MLHQTRLVFLSLIAVSFGSNLMGQAVTGSIVGVVIDPNGAVIAKAAITATQPTTGVTRAVASDGFGQYTLPFLAPGSYDLSISAPGFKTWQKAAVLVEISTTARADAQLVLGQQSEVIQVSGEAPLLQTDRADLVRSFSSTAAVNLPLPGRNVYELASLLPGVTPTSNISSTLQNPMDGRAFQANGQLRSSNNQQLDGVDNNDPLIGVTINVPPVEMVEEISYSTGSFSAESGRAGGAMVNVRTRGGTNQLHGSLFAFNQVDRLRARNFFNTVDQPKPNYLRNQFGGTIGGPIRKDKTFFFGSFQGVSERRGNTQTATVPVSDWRRGDFGGVPGLNLFDPATGTANGTGRQLFPDNRIPISRFHPVSSRLLPDLRSPNLTGLQANLIDNVLSRIAGRQFGTRVDHKLDERTSLFVKYDLSRFDVENDAILGRAIGEGAGSSVITHTAVLSAVTSFSATLIAENRFGFNRYRSNVEGFNAEENLSAKYGVGNPNPDRLSTRGLARIAIAGMPPIGAPFIYPVLNTDNIFNLSSHWTKLYGRHTIKFGGDLRRLRLDRLQATGLNLGPRGLFNFNPGTTALRGGPALGPFGQFGNSFAAFLVGAPDQISRTFLTVTPTNRQWNVFGYLNDTWQIGRKLTLDLGVRWELYTPVVPRYAGGASNYDPSTNSLLVAGIGDAGMSTGIVTDWNNLAPRFGFAYRASERLVVRGGYGISYFTGINGFTGGTLSTQFPVVGNIQVGNVNDFTVDGALNAIPAIPPTPIPPNGIISPAPNQAFFHVPFNNRYPYVQSFNLTVQRSLGAGFVADIAYVGTLGRKLPVQIDLNAAPPGTGVAGRPLNRLFGRTATTNERTYRANNNYHGLQASLLRRFRNGLFLQGSYTYSKAMEEGVITSHTDISRNYGPASYDRTQMFTLAHVYDLPFGAGQRWLATGPAARLAGDWKWNGVFRAVTGLPFTASADATPCNCPGNGNFADAVSPIRYPRGTGRGELWFNTGAFAAPGPSRFGNAGAGTIRGPGFGTYDMSVFRQFPIRERLRLEFRVEAFNLTNTPLFGAPDRNVNSANFGQVLTTLDGAGERQLQFALRLSF